MALFEWDDRFSVGVTEMDNHHKKLFDILNKLFDDAREGKGAEAVAGTIGELIRYTEYHFAEEEAKLANSAYPHLADHKAKHRAFVDQLKDYKAQADSGGGIFVVNKVAQTGTDWLKTHILQVDQEYEQYLAK